MHCSDGLCTQLHLQYLSNFCAATPRPLCQCLCVFSEQHVVWSRWWLERGARECMLVWHCCRVYVLLRATPWRRCGVSVCRTVIDQRPHLQRSKCVRIRLLPVQSTYPYIRPPLPTCVYLQPHVGVYSAQRDSNVRPPVHTHHCVQCIAIHLPKCHALCGCNVPTMQQLSPHTLCARGLQSRPQHRVRTMLGLQRLQRIRRHALWSLQRHCVSQLHYLPCYLLAAPRVLARCRYRLRQLHGVPL